MSTYQQILKVHKKFHTIRHLQVKSEGSPRHFESSFLKECHLAKVKIQSLIDRVLELEYESKSEVNQISKIRIL